MARTTGTSSNGSSIRLVGTDAATDITSLWSMTGAICSLDAQQDEVGVFHGAQVVGRYLHTEEGSAQVGVLFAVNGGPHVLRQHQPIVEEGAQQDSTELAEPDDGDSMFVCLFSHLDPPRLRLPATGGQLRPGVGTWRGYAWFNRDQAAGRRRQHARACHKPKSGTDL